jgi:hypothetical protein
VARKISDTNFSRSTANNCGDVSDGICLAMFRIGFSSNPVQSNKPNLTRRARFLLWIKTEFLYRSALFVWLVVLEGIISAVLLHPAQNPPGSPHCLQNKRTGSGLNIYILYISVVSVKRRVCNPFYIIYF